MMENPRTWTFVIPGTQVALTYERDEAGCLTSLRCNGRTYLEGHENKRTFGDGFATVSETLAANSLLRYVRAAQASWTEVYRWDEQKRLVHTDGVEMRYDEHDRITACLGSCGDWFYAYANQDLVAIEGPFGVRHLTRGPDGRPIRTREGNDAHDIAYDNAGRRMGIPTIPANWHRDTLGRLWTITDPDGTVRTTYLWDNFTCLGRIDGPPGNPWAAVFSLDPTFTPVRVITEQGTTRIPRDAFGEGLLAHPGGPGLYGGTVHDGFVHLPLRVLDPRTGAFNTPDPWHGQENDPRRAKGYQGPLLVEKAPAGPYAVCQNDPVGRADPLGAASAESVGRTIGLAVADITWAYQNNVASWIVLDFFLNLWGSLFGSLFSWDSTLLDSFGDSDGLYNERMGTYGVRRGGWVGNWQERAWAVQHIIWSEAERFDELNDVRVFKPSGEFRPTLYGSILLVTFGEDNPKDTLVLRGMRNPGNVIISDDLPIDWTRAGGQAEPVIPDSPVPHFPWGGLHCEGPMREGLRGPLEATITELEGSGPLGIGAFSGEEATVDRLVATVGATGLDLRAGSYVLLTDSAGGAVISAVLAAAEDGGSTQVHVEPIASGLTPPIELLPLDRPASREAADCLATLGDYLSTEGTTGAYVPGDILRLSQGASIEGVARIDRLEAKINIDEALPASLEQPLTVAVAQVEATSVPQTVTITAAQEIDFTGSNNIPAKDDAIMLTNGATPPTILAAVITNDALAGNLREVDRDLTGFGVGSNVDWQPLIRNTELGIRNDVPETDLAVTYTPHAVRTAPASGYLWVEGNDPPADPNAAVLAVRTVQNRAHDALVLDATPPGNTANPYEVERFAARGGPQAVTLIDHQDVVVFQAAERLDAVIEETGLDLEVGEYVLLTDDNAGLVVSAILAVAEDINGGITRIHVETNASVLGSGVNLRNLGGVLVTDTANSVAGTDDTLDATGTTGAYAPGDVLRMTQGPAVESAAQIDRLEAEIAIDSDPLPAAMEQPLTVATAQQSGVPQSASLTANPFEVDFTPPPVLADPLPAPGIGDALTLTDPVTNTTLAVVVTDDLGGNLREVDRDPLAAGLPGPPANVDWQPLIRGMELGVRDNAPENASAVTYAPHTARMVPMIGDFLWIDGTDAPAVAGEPLLAVREVTDITSNKIILDRPLPGDTALAYEVQRFAPRGNTHAVSSVDRERELMFDVPMDLEGVAAMQVQWLDPAALGAASYISGASIAPGSLVATVNSAALAAAPNSPCPAQVVHLTDGAGSELALVTRVRVTCILDRRLTVGESGLEVVPLQAGGPQYKARQLGPLVLDFDDTPPYADGARLTIDWTNSNQHQYRATPLEGTVLTLENGAEQVLDVTDGNTVTQARVVGPLTVVVLPSVDVGGVVKRVHMPRFGTGEIIEANWGAATSVLDVAAIAGTQITLEDAANQSIYAVDLTVRRLVPQDPGTGSSRAGIRGEPVGGTPTEEKVTTDRLRFQVWQPDALNGSPKVAIVDKAAIVDGDKVLPAAFPAVVDSGAGYDIEIAFADPPGISGVGNIDIEGPNVFGTRYATQFAREADGRLSIRDDWTPPTSTGTPLVAAIPFRPADPIRTAAGELHPGSVLVPEETECELTRYQSLVAHELTHSKQYVEWGPLMLAYFPTWVLEMGLELGTDVEMPIRFSEWVSATVRQDESAPANPSARSLDIENAQGIPFAQGDTVQLFWESSFETVQLCAPNAEGHFRIISNLPISEGGSIEVRVRRLEWDPAVDSDIIAAETFIDLFKILSVGGLTNTIVGSIYGGILYGLGKLFYAAGRGIFGSGDTYPATVATEGVGEGEMGKVLTLDDEAGRQAIGDASRVIVQSGDATVVRTVNQVQNSTLRLRSAVDFTGEVRVAPYDTHTPASHWDWYDYYPAQVPDPDRPSTIQIFEASEDDSLELHVHARVIVTAADPTDQRRTTVIAVHEDGTVDLADVPPTSGEERDLRIAEIGENDPMGYADSWLMNEMGMGGLRWITDPWGQIHFRSHADPKLDWLLRTLRYVLGTRSWSIALLGSVLWFILLDQSRDEGHLSPLEQEASEESGELYSPIGRLFGSTDVVGDVARYWYFANNKKDTLIASGKQDAPGVHIKEDVRFMPLVTGEPGGSDPNRGATAGASATEPGNAVSDAFVKKGFIDPTDVTSLSSSPVASFAPSDQGWIPTSAVLERTIGAYVAFTRPGRHRVTVRDNVDKATAGREAQIDDEEEGEPRTSPLPPYDQLQTLFFEYQVNDVMVTVAGRVVTDTDPATSLPIAPLPTVRLVQTQRAVVRVDSPRGPHAVALTRPETGDVLQAEEEQGLVIIAQAKNSTDPEPVEVARVYHYDAEETYTEDGPNHHGVHLPRDLFIPVRQFNVEVVDTLAVRSQMPSGEELASDLEMNVHAIGELRPGEEGYILVPAHMIPWEGEGEEDEENFTKETFSHAVTLIPAPTNPVLNTEGEDGLEGRAAFVGDGGIIRITPRVDAPPEEQTKATISIQVGSTGNNATLEAVINLIPHFRLVLPGGGDNYQFTLDPGGADTDVVLNCEDAGGNPVNVSSVTVTQPEGGSTAGITTAFSGAEVTLTLGAGAVPEIYQILVEGPDGHMGRRTIEITSP